ncbi:MAG TPA: OB-fold nucleic acid binding domain-containing protein, partial [Candidatus Nanoarchaeia archaeon]|nr:OB-fold nucleic acid binding domain-containing protein [Candidatus Nanoarchaeia archaeon]
MSSIDDIRAGRLKKLELIKARGIEAYPVKAIQDYTIAEVVSKYPTLSKEIKPTTLVGRVLSLRPQGAIVFFTFDDGTGKFQGFIKKGEGMADGDFDFWMNTVDVGDFVQVTGTFFETQRGEKTLNVTSWTML